MKVKCEHSCAHPQSDTVRDPPPPCLPTSLRRLQPRPPRPPLLPPPPPPPCPLHQRRSRPTRGRSCAPAGRTAFCRPRRSPPAWDAASHTCSCDSLPHSCVQGRRAERLLKESWSRVQKPSVRLLPRPGRGSCRLTRDTHAPETCHTWHAHARHTRAHATLSPLPARTPIPTVG